MRVTKGKTLRQENFASLAVGNSVISFMGKSILKGLKILPSKRKEGKRREKQRELT